MSTFFSLNVNYANTKHRSSKLSRPVTMTVVVVRTVYMIYYYYIYYYFRFRMALVIGLQHCPRHGNPRGSSRVNLEATGLWQ